MAQAIPEADAEPRPIRLGWWQAEPNFGDALSPAVVEYVSGRRTLWAPFTKADLVGVGSILQDVGRDHDEPRPDGSKPFIWGTGLMYPHGGKYVKNLRIKILRGPLSATVLRVPADCFGDPGLLAREALNLGEIVREDRIALVAHHKHIDDPMLAELLKIEPALKLVDPRDDLRSVVRAIASSAHVISSSLHGLIVADSFGIANTWLNPQGIHANPEFKFYDYATGVQRPLAPPVMLDEVPDLVRRLKSPERLSYAEGLEASKTALAERFPRILRAA